MRVFTREEKLEYFKSNEVARELLIKDLTKIDGEAPGSIEEHIDRVMVKEVSPKALGVAIDKDENGAFTNLKEYQLRSKPKH